MKPPNPAGRGEGRKKRGRAGQAPPVRLQRALELAGIPPESQTRGHLRSIIHKSAGSPPPDHCDAEMLAEIVLVLHSRGKLRRS